MSKLYTRGHKPFNPFNPQPPCDCDLCITAHHQSAARPIWTLAAVSNAVNPHHRPNNPFARPPPVPRRIHMTFRNHQAAIIDLNEEARLWDLQEIEAERERQRILSEHAARREAEEEIARRLLMQRASEEYAQREWEGSLLYGVGWIARMTLLGSVWGLGWLCGLTWNFAVKPWALPWLIAVRDTLDLVLYVATLVGEVLSYPLGWLLYPLVGLKEALIMALPYVRMILPAPFHLAWLIGCALVDGCGIVAPVVVDAVSRWSRALGKWLLCVLPWVALFLWVAFYQNLFPPREQHRRRAYVEPPGWTGWAKSNHAAEFHVWYVGPS